MLLPMRSPMWDIARVLSGRIRYELYCWHSSFESFRRGSLQHGLSHLPLGKARRTADQPGTHPRKAFLLGQYFHQHLELIKKHYPQLWKHLKMYEADPIIYASSWFITIFCNCFPSSYSFRILECLLLEGRSLQIQDRKLFIGLLFNFWRWRRKHWRNSIRLRASLRSWKIMMSWLTRISIPFSMECTASTSAGNRSMNTRPSSGKIARKISSFDINTCLLILTFTSMLLVWPLA